MTQDALRVLCASEICLACVGDLSTSRRTLYKADLEKIWLYDFFDRRDFFTEYGCERRESYGCSVKSINEVTKEFSIQGIESKGIDTKSFEYTFT